MPISLRQVPLPDFGPLGAQPTIPAATYAARCDAAYGGAGCEWLVVYADREHLGNIVFLTGFEPRFEEALLLLGPGGRRVIVTGNESESYAAISPLPDLEVLLAQTLSLMGQDRTRRPRLADALREAGIGPGQSVGLVGWKYLEPFEDAAGGFFVPGVIVDILRQVVGAEGRLVEATPVLMHPETGLRGVIDADQIAAFEWAAAKGSAALWRIVAGVREGDSEFEAVARMGYEGDPLSVHTMFASAGAGDAIIGLRSPTARRLRLGDGVTTAVGMWGALSSRAGLFSRGDDDFLATAAGYFEALIAWYETADIGVSGGALHEAVIAALARSDLGSALNPGHLTGHEEWMNTPVRPGSAERLRSGMPFQIDVIPVPMPAGRALNCEDPVTFADAALRAELRQRHPETMRRIEARRSFMRDQLGVDVRDSILPLSSTPLYLPPFWLKADHVLVRN